MKRKTLIALAVAAAFAVPLAYADSGLDKTLQGSVIAMTDDAIPEQDNDGGDLIRLPNPVLMAEGDEKEGSESSQLIAEGDEKEGSESSQLIAEGDEKEGGEKADLIAEGDEKEGSESSQLIAEGDDKEGTEKVDLIA